MLDLSPASPLFPFPSALFREFPSSSIDAFKVRRPFPALVPHVYWLFFAPSNYRFCHCLYPLRHKLSPINEGSFSQDPLLSLFTFSVCARHSPSPHQLLRCLSSNENGQHPCFSCDTSCFRFIDSIPESVSAFHRRLLLPVSFTTWFPQYAFAYCVSLAAFVPIPPCLPHASFALRSLCIPHPLWLGISQTRKARLFAGFYRIVLSEPYIFLGTGLLFLVPIGAFQSQSLLLKTLLLVFISHSISCVKYS